MAEVDFTAVHGATLTPSRGRGLKLIGADITVSDAETLTTGLSEISGVSYLASDAAVDANTPLLYIKTISGGTITFSNGEIGAYTNITDMTAYVLIMGVLR